MRNNLLFRHWAGIVCLMCAVVFHVQYAVATNVSGTTYASNLEYGLDAHRHQR